MRPLPTDAVAAAVRHQGAYPAVHVRQEGVPWVHTQQPSRIRR